MLKSKNFNFQFKNADKVTYLHFLVTKRKFGSSINYNILYEPDKDYYKILNLEENADSAQIKKAFYTLSVKHHPDKGGKEEDFKSINSAYEVLKSEKDKKIYDKLRSDYFEDLKRRIKLNNRKGDSFSKQQKEDSGKKEKRKYQSDYYYSNNFYNYQEYNYKRNKQHSQYQDSYYNDTNNDFYSDYKHNFKEDTSDKNFDATYQEFMEMMRKYYEDQQESNKANYSENRFDKFKVNVKYIPLEKQKLYEDFKIEPVHRHHMDNRIKKYKLELEKQLRLQNRRFLKYKTKTIAKNLNPFEIYSDMNTDKDFIKAMNSELHCSDDESLQSKFTFKEIFKVFDKRKATAFLFLNFILAYILLK